MFDEEPPVPEEVLISAKDQLNEEEIAGGQRGDSPRFE